MFSVITDQPVDKTSEPLENNTDQTETLCLQFSERSSEILNSLNDIFDQAEK